MKDALARIEAQFAIPVLRQSDPEVLFQVSQALARGGLAVVEITLMSDAAHAAIKRLASSGACYVGAGTVRTLEQAERAVKDGARFIVSPGFIESIADFCSKAAVPFVPGVLTPTEVQRASNHGCKVLKVFPVQAVGGPAYLKHLSGPFPDLRWMATGGVSTAEISAYLQAKAFAIGLGSQLFPPGAIENQQWSDVEASARAIVTEIARLRPGV
ncbi:MAG: bifunctional 4-hydroxy-2-oxoglutarate aldolase/2-dehydro-3-deoxy-phosphogluconate aldolase [Bdellovibrionota bacterium]